MQTAIKEFHEKIKERYGQQLVKLILFGSWARETATKESDIDLLVVLEGEIQPGREIDRMIDIITDIDLKYDTLLSVVPIAREEFEERNSPLLLNVRKEGIVVE